EIASKHGLSVEPKKIEATWKRVWAEKDAQNQRLGQAGSRHEKLWWKDIVQGVFADLGAFENFDAFFDELFVSFGREARWKMFEEVPYVLGVLKSRGIQMAIVSNWDGRLFKLLEELKISHYFRGVFISSVLGTAKPEKKIFDIAMERMGVHPIQTIHVGDSLVDDVHGAKNAGIRPVHIDRETPASSKPKGFIRIASLKDILEVETFL
ncbi:MAG: HAD-IA family hydrolase, partial [Spirochaetia bacterium]|nr:HAD-IA family hydrolase [Spirochaetia bacterium]